MGAALGKGLSQKEAEAAARGCIVKFSRGRSFAIRCAEILLLPLVRCVDAVRSLRNGNTGATNRILVLEAGNLGDIVGILPFLQNLRVRYPNAHITFLTSPQSFPLLQNLNLVDEILPMRFPWAIHLSRWKRYNPFSAVSRELIGIVLTLRRRSFDLALSGRGDLRDNFVLWLIGVPRRVGYAFFGGRSLLTEVAMPDLDHVHRADCWLRLLEHLGNPVEDRRPRLKLSAEEQEFASKFLHERGVVDGAPIIGIHPGARIRTRQWGWANFKAVGENLCTRFPLKILWFQDPGEHAPGAIPDGFIPVALPLREFMAVLSRCGVLICNDSGPMHIATALGVPVLGVFGPTEPAWFGPLGEQNRIVIRQPFWCRPCADRCIFDQPYCLRTISVQRVVDSALDFIENGPLGTKHLTTLT